MTARIVGTGPIDLVAADIFRPFGEIAIAPDGNEASLLPLLPDAVALVVRGDGAASAKVIAAAPRLKVIGRTGAGCNNVDIAAATARKIPVVYTPGANARAVAEGALALMLALCKRIVHWDRQLKQGNWKSRFESMPGDLEGATLGIVGFGAIGQSLAELVRPFHMTVLAHDPFASQARAQELGVTLVELDDLFRRSDFISLNAALTDQTRHLVNRARLQRVKPGAVLVNLARGGLIESLDVLDEALRSGRLAGVGLDVFDPEPPDVSHPIFRLENCLCAPHALGMTPAAMGRIFRTMAEDMAAVLTGRRPRHVVNPETLNSTRS